MVRKLTYVKMENMSSERKRQRMKRERKLWTAILQKCPSKMSISQCLEAVNMLLYTGKETFQI